jgi:hypothetical protein
VAENDYRFSITASSPESVPTGRSRRSGYPAIKTTMTCARFEQRDAFSQARDLVNMMNQRTTKPDLKLVE